MKDLNCETAKKIIDSATELFNNNGYAGTSISGIAKKAEMSKGILYHYFKDKDALYLHCLKLCVDNFIEYMSDNVKNLEEKEDIILEILKIRLSFFDVYPQYHLLFHNIISLKPNHLQEEVRELKFSMRNNNLKLFKTVTKGIKLGKGVTDYDVMTLLTILQNNAQFVEDINGGTLPANSLNVAQRITKIFINGLKEDLE